jgi:hypothetical protein
MSLELYDAYRAENLERLDAVLQNDGIDVFTQIDLLAAALASNARVVIGKQQVNLKDIARKRHRKLVVGDEKGVSPLNQAVKAAYADMQTLRLDPSPLEALAHLPYGSVALDLPFRLLRPFLSRDDDAFHIIDNPVRKEKVFRVPMVAASSWKGSLRAAALYMLVSDAISGASPPVGWQVQTVWPARDRCIRLFGDETEGEAHYINHLLAELSTPKAQTIDPPNEAAQAKVEQERQKAVNKRAEQIDKEYTAHLIASGYRTEEVTGYQGRLAFFPTFFPQVGMEIINPRDRAQVVGTDPIPFECVPARTAGSFRLLYTPVQAATSGDPHLPEQVEAEMTLALRAVWMMLTVLGFGAKTSSGYGVASDALIPPATLRYRTHSGGMGERTFKSISEVANGAKGLAGEVAA